MQDVLLEPRLKYGQGVIRRTCSGHVTVPSHIGIAYREHSETGAQELG